jgi:hypothetical protein
LLCDIASETGHSGHESGNTDHKHDLHQILNVEHFLQPSEFYRCIRISLDGAAVGAGVQNTAYNITELIYRGIALNELGIAELRGLVHRDDRAGKVNLRAQGARVLDLAIVIH